MKMEEEAKEEIKEEFREVEEIQTQSRPEIEKKPEKIGTEERVERPKKRFPFPKIKTNKKFWIILVSILILAAIIYLGVWIRTQNIPQLRDATTGEYTLGPDLDPFLFLRYAQTIEQQGSLPEIDMMRYTPAGGVPTKSVSFISYSIFYLYRLFSLESIEYAAIIYPVVCFALGLLFFFLFVQKLFSHIFKDKEDRERLIYSIVIALIATALLAVFPSYLHRTTAGIPEKEAPGMFFFWFSFYCLINAWQAKGKKSLVFAILAGIGTGLMTWTWGGVRFIFMVFALFAFLTFMFDKISRKQKLVYSIWVFFSLILIFLVSGAGGIKNFFTGLDTLLAFSVFAILIANHIFYGTKLKEKLKLEKIKLPHSIVTLIIVFVVGLILASLFFGFSFISDKVVSIKEGLLYPFGRSRVGLTVAENKQPYFLEWFNEFTPFFFWLFFIGTIFMFYEATKHFEKKNKFWLNFFFILFITTFIFSRYSPQSIFNGENFISQVLYFGGLILFVFMIFLFYIRAHVKKDESVLDNFKNISFSYLFVLVFIFWMILASRGAIRLFFISGTAFILAVSFLPVKLFDYGFKSKDMLRKIILWVVVILAACLIVITFINYQKVTLINARGTVPGAYYQQWQKAMAWVRENTAEDSLFIHWWDYGYWVQTIGERATVTDGGHYTNYWDHLIGRYLLTAQEEKTALQLCKSYGVDYLLIDSTDIGKYSAYSSIGSDETGYDRLSWINNFVLDEKQTQEKKDEIAYVYVGGTYFDKDVEWKDQIFPRNKAAIAGFILVTDKETGSINEIKAVVYHNSKEFRVPIKYIYINNELKELEQKDEELMEGALYILPRVTQQGINAMGASLYLSEKAINAFWVNAYLFDNVDNFELVHKEDNLYIAGLKQANISIGDFLIGPGGFLGPIKIWKVHYPEDIKEYEEYRKIWADWEQNKIAALDHLGT